MKDVAGTRHTARAFMTWKMGLAVWEAGSVVALSSLPTKAKLLHAAATLLRGLQASREATLYASLSGAADHRFLMATDVATISQVAFGAQSQTEREGNDFRRYFRTAVVEAIEFYLDPADGLREFMISLVDEVRLYVAPDKKEMFDNLTAQVRQASTTAYSDRQRDMTSYALAQEMVEVFQDISFCNDMTYVNGHPTRVSLFQIGLQKGSLEYDSARQSVVVPGFVLDREIPVPLGKIVYDGHFEPRLLTDMFEEAVARPAYTLGLLTPIKLGMGFEPVPTPPTHPCVDAASTTSAAPR